MRIFRFLLGMSTALALLCSVASADWVSPYPQPCQDPNTGWAFCYTTGISDTYGERYQEAEAWVFEGSSGAWANTGYSNLTLEGYSRAENGSISFPLACHAQMSIDEDGTTSGVGQYGYCGYWELWAETWQE